MELLRGLAVLCACVGEPATCLPGIAAEDFWSPLARGAVGFPSVLSRPSDSRHGRAPWIAICCSGI